MAIFNYNLWSNIWPTGLIFGHKAKKLIFWASQHKISTIFGTLCDSRWSQELFKMTVDCRRFSCSQRPHLVQPTKQHITLRANFPRQRGQKTDFLGSNVYLNELSKFQRFLVHVIHFDLRWSKELCSYRKIFVMATYMYNQRSMVFKVALGRLS